MSCFQNKNVLMMNMAESNGMHYAAGNDSVEAVNMCLRSLI